MIAKKKYSVLCSAYWRGRVFVWLQ